MRQRPKKAILLFSGLFLFIFFVAGMSGLANAEDTVYYYGSNYRPVNTFETLELSNGWLMWD